MSRHIWRLPWTLDSVPHALLDIARGCNITCRACYNLAPPGAKDIKEISRELDILIRLRKLHSVSLIGGEVMMHPQVCEIARMVRDRGLHVELFTNGSLLTPRNLGALAGAGVEAIFMHIEPGQIRPDLPENASLDDWRELAAAKTELVAGHGMEAGLTITAFEDRPDEMIEAVRFVLDSPHADYLLITLFRDVSAIAAIHGDLASGMTGSLEAGAGVRRNDNLDNLRVLAILEHEFGLRPFACVGSNLDPHDPRWLSYMVGTVRTPGRAPAYSSVKVSLAEKFFLRAFRTFRGRYPFYQRTSPGRFLVQILLNTISGGSIRENASLLRGALRKGTAFGYKRILVQCLADVLPDGRVVHCECCPDAVVRGEGLVPVCIADKIKPAAAKMAADRGRTA
jgi:hypothetical protein